MGPRDDLDEKKRKQEYLTYSCQSPTQQLTTAEVNKMGFRALLSHLHNWSCWPGDARKFAPFHPESGRRIYRRNSGNITQIRAVQSLKNRITPTFRRYFYDDPFSKT
jgi:hypothetical protein